MPKMKRRYEELSELKGKIRAEKYSYRTLAQEANMSKCMLSNKLNGYYCFNTNEMENIMGILRISSQELAKYFFPSLVRDAPYKVS